MRQNDWAYGKPEQNGLANLKLQLSIRGAMYLTTVIAVYAAIVALAYRGDFWGKGITFAVTCTLGVWFLSAIAYWVLMGLLAFAGFHEPQSSIQRSGEEYPPASPTSITQTATLLNDENSSEIHP